MLHLSADQVWVLHFVQNDALAGGVRNDEQAGEAQDDGQRRGVVYPFQ